jgi:hypothetical protein
VTLVVAEPHEMDRRRQVYRTRSAGGRPVSVRTDRAGHVDYVRVGSGAWGGELAHEDAAALFAVLAVALAAGPGAVQLPEPPDGEPWWVPR